MNSKKGLNTVRGNPIHANSPGLCGSLLDTAPISCSPALPLLHSLLISSTVSGHFCRYLVTDKDYFWHQNADCKILIVST